MFDVIGFVIGSAAATAVIGAATALGAVSLPLLAAAAAVGGTGFIVGLATGVVNDCIEYTRNVAEKLVDQINLKMPNGFPVKFEVDNASIIVNTTPIGGMTSTVTIDVKASFRNDLTPAYTLNEMANIAKNVLAAVFDGKTIKATVLKNKYSVRGGNEYNFVNVDIIIHDNIYDDPNTPFYFIGEDERGLVVHAIVVVIDGVTNSLKAVHVERININASYFTITQTRSNACNDIAVAIGCPFYTVGYWLGLEKGWSSKSVCMPPGLITIYKGYVIHQNFSLKHRITFNVKGLVDVGDIIRVYFVTPAFAFQLMRLCKNNAREDLKDVCSLTKSWCDGGYVLDPDVLIRTVKMFGYYNEDVMKLAIALANGGYVAGKIEILIDNEIVKFNIKETSAKIIIKEPEIKGNEITAIRSRVKTVDLTKEQTVNVVSVGSVVVDVPVPYGMYVEGVDNNNYYLIINPLGINVGAKSNVRSLNFITSRGVFGKFDVDGLMIAQLPDYELDMNKFMAYGGKVTVKLVKDERDKVPVPVVSVETEEKDAVDVMRLNGLLSAVARTAVGLSVRARIATPYALLNALVTAILMLKAKLSETVGERSACIEVKRGEVKIKECGVR